jgi:hypothetical protein
MLKAARSLLLDILEQTQRQLASTTALPQL